MSVIEIENDVDNTFSVIRDEYCTDKKTSFGIASYSKTYRNTNELLSVYLPLLIKRGSKVLSVAASGDQYLSSVLYGAKEVELFDKNPISYYYSMLKICAATHLSFDDYMKFIVEGGEKDFLGYNMFLERHYIKKIESFLPEDVALFYTQLNRLIDTMEYPDLNGLFLDSCMDFNNDIVSFLKRSSYQELQDKLKSMKYPKFYLGDIEQILPKIKNKYDLILLSNIKDYAEDDFFEKNRENVLNRLNKGGVAQMDYVWSIASILFAKEKYTIDKNGLIPLVFPSFEYKRKLKSRSDDGILLLKKM